MSTNIKRYLRVLLTSCVMIMASATYADPDSEQYRRTEGFKQSIVYATLTARVKSELLVNNNTPGLAINVDSKDGVVTLSGEVESSTEKEIAERIASNVNGTESVSNQLIVEPTQ